MLLSEIKDQVEGLIGKFGADTEVFFSIYDDQVCECFTLNVHFNSVDIEDDKVMVTVNFDN